MNPSLSASSSTEPAIAREEICAEQGGFKIGRSCKAAVFSSCAAWSISRRAHGNTSGNAGIPERSSLNRISPRKFFPYSGTSRREIWQRFFISPGLIEKRPAACNASRVALPRCPNTAPAPGQTTGIAASPPASRESRTSSTFAKNKPMVSGAKQIAICAIPSFLNPSRYSPEEPSCCPVIRKRICSRGHADPDWTIRGQGMPSGGREGTNETGEEA